MCIQIAVWSVVASLAHAQSIAILPGRQASGASAPVFSDSLLGTVAVANGVPEGAFQLLSAPDGSKSYLLSASAGFTVLDRSLGNPVQVLTSLGRPTRAGLSPDGRLMVAIVGNSAYLVDAASDVIAGGPFSFSGAFDDMAFRFDSRTAYLLSHEDPSATVTAIDLTTRTPGDAVSFSAGGVNSMAMAPSGLLYVSALNGLFEIDPDLMRLNAGANSTTGATIPVRAAPETLWFTSDSHYAVALSRTPLAVAAVLFDLTARTATTISSAGLDSPLDQLALASDSRIIARSQNGRLYEAYLWGSFRDSGAASALAPGSTVASMLVSSEAPARYLYLIAGANGGSTLYRVDLATNGIASKTSLPPQAGNLLASTPFPTADGNMVVQAVNSYQTVAARATSRPLVARLLDSAGRPVYRSKVSFSPLCGGLSLDKTVVETNASGYAMAFAAAGDDSGSYLVQAAIPGGVGGGATYTVDVVGDSGLSGGCKPLVDSPRISIVRGDGQLVPEQAMALQPLMVSVQDTDGNPMPNHPVRFSIVNGIGTIACPGVSAPFWYVPTGRCSVLSMDSLWVMTDGTGRAAVTFMSSSVLGQSFAQTLVRATSLFASVDFTVTTVLLARSNGSLASLPAADIFAPLASSEPGLVGVRIVNGASGHVVRRAIQIQVTPADGPQAGQPIPHVALNVVAPDDVSSQPSGVCVGGAVLTDATGVATCDLVLGPVTGTAFLNVNIGDVTETPLMGIVVIPGKPLAIQALQGDNQVAHLGRALTLRGQVRDENGLPVAGVPIEWQTPPKGATLHSASRYSDEQGYVQANLTLSLAPGPAAIRFTAAPGSTAAATTTFTVTGIY